MCLVFKDSKVASTVALEKEITDLISKSKLKEVILLEIQENGLLSTEYEFLQKLIGRYLSLPNKRPNEKYHRRLQ